MEIGFGFLVGALGGGVLALVISVIVMASRRVVKAAAATPPAQEPAAPPQEPEARKGTSARLAAEGRSSGHTVVIGEMESRETNLGRSIQDVRDLLLSLADVISNTENASGKATLAFTSAKDSLGNIDLSDIGNCTELAEAQRALVNEIDRVLKTNVSLHSELDRANQGIAEQRRQIEELRVQARVDSLTRIPNRAAFDERIGEYISLLERANLAFTLMLLDIDHFKRVNDLHGHINGDRILRGVAAKISDCVRNNDFTARYGGEEFAVIFPGTKLQDARMVAERMRQDIAKTNFRMDDQNVKITVSGGLAECSKGMTSEEIIAQADKTLYLAKAEGRNRIRTTDDAKTTTGTRAIPGDNG